jgi:hypothetical protein
MSQLRAATTIRRTSSTNSANSQVLRRESFSRGRTWLFDIAASDFYNPPWRRQHIVDTVNKVLSMILVVALMPLLLCDVLLADQADNSKGDPWNPLRFFVGRWEGDVKGEPGSGKVQREYSFILNDRFIHIVNRSLYPPQEKNPKGEKHEDIGFFSYDKFTKKFVLRQFHIEGFVNQFAAESISEDRRTIVFVSTAIENITPGWRARETYRILNDNEFIETFALAEPNNDFNTYSETHFRRKK